MLKIIKENIRNVEFLVNKMYGVTHMGKFHADEVFASVILDSTSERYTLFGVKTKTSEGVTL